MWDGLFQNRLIETYEQLQELIQTAKRTGKGQPSNTALWDMIGTLERYNRDFFLSEALCISILRLDQEYDLKLSSVSARENNEGHMKLYIEVEKVLSNDRGEPSERQTYSGCFVHVPREIAQKCSCVEVKIKKE